MPNFSLLYDAGNPTLAPLYDIVSTAIYPQLTTRLAMSIDGARQIDEVGPAAWARLAKEVRYSARFAGTQTEGMIERVIEEASKLAAQPRHDNEVVAQILWSIIARRRQGQWE